MRCQQLSLGLSASLPELSDDVLRETHSRLHMTIAVEEALKTPYLRQCLVRSTLLHAHRNQKSVTRRTA